MPTLSDYDSFESFFSENKSGALTVLMNKHSEFKEVFDNILEISKTNFKSKQKGAAAALYLRAMKYLYTAHALAVEGHTEESRILLRNVVELMVLGFLVFKHEDVYELWSRCLEERKSITSDEGNVELKKIKRKEYEFNAITSKYSENLKSDDDVNQLLRHRGELSTFYSHENLYNIAVRMEQGETSSDIYIGTSYRSKNDRMLKNMQETINLLKNIKSLMKKIVNSL
ncbi:MAG: hypothetical protein WD967_01630 [Candidatus Levyibacteriota bacterium]